jgi:hypothetical protein
MSSMKESAAGELDQLSTAVVNAERHATRDEGKAWDGSAWLYALVDRDEVLKSVSNSPAWLVESPAGSLVAVQQDPLGEGELGTALTGIAWPDTVSGCVLVTELTVLPVGPEPVSAEVVTDGRKRATGASDGGDEARIAVGVLRDGSYSCVLRLRDEDELFGAPGLADEWVTALLATF